MNKELLKELNEQQGKIIHSTDKSDSNMIMS